MKQGKLLSRTVKRVAVRSVREERDAQHVGVITLTPSRGFLDENGVEHAYEEIYERDTFRDKQRRLNNPFLNREPGADGETEMAVASFEWVVYLMLMAAILFPYVWSILRAKLFNECRTYRERQLQAREMNKQFIANKEYEHALRHGFTNKLIIPIKMPKIIRKTQHKHAPKVKVAAQDSISNESSSTVNTFFSVTKFQPGNIEEDSGPSSPSPSNPADNSGLNTPTPEVKTVKLVSKRYREQRQHSSSGSSNSTDDDNLEVLVHYQVKVQDEKKKETNKKANHPASIKRKKTGSVKEDPGSKTGSNSNSTPRSSERSQKSAKGKGHGILRKGGPKKDKKDESGYAADDEGVKDKDNVSKVSSRKKKDQHP